MKLLFILAAAVEVLQTFLSTEKKEAVNGTPRATSTAASSLQAQGEAWEIIIVQSCTEVTAVVRLDKASETVKKVEASDGSDRQVFGAGLDSFCLNYDGGGGGWYFGVISSNTCGTGVSGYVVSAINQKNVIFIQSQFSVMY